MGSGAALYYTAYFNMFYCNAPFARFRRVRRLVRRASRTFAHRPYTAENRPRCVWEIEYSVRMRAYACMCGVPSWLNVKATTKPKEILAKSLPLPALGLHCVCFFVCLFVLPFPFFPARSCTRCTWHLRPP